MDINFTDCNTSGCLIIKFEEVPSKIIKILDELVNDSGSRIILEQF